MLVSVDEKDGSRKISISNEGAVFFRCVEDCFYFYDVTKSSRVRRKEPDHQSLCVVCVCVCVWCVCVCVCVCVQVL